MKIHYIKKHSAEGAARSNLISLSLEYTLAANFVFILKVGIKTCLTVKVQEKITSERSVLVLLEGT